MRKMKEAGIGVEEMYSDEEVSMVPDLVYVEPLCGFLEGKVSRGVMRNGIEIEKPDTAIGSIARRGSTFLSAHPRNIVEVEMGGERPQVESRKLPIEGIRDSLMEFISRNQAMVIVGETGSGKSTRLPRYLYDEGYGEKGVIGCTQPRRAAAINLASTLRNDLGTVVGHSVRFDNTTRWDTKIKYMTEGILLQEILGDGMLGKYSVIILDEAHERSTNLDISMGLLKPILKRRPDLKLIIMSATMDVQKLCSYFGCPSFSIEGRSYPVDIQYLSVDVDDYIEWAVKKILHIHESCREGDILVFVTGKEDVDGVVGIVNHCIENNCFGGKEKRQGRLRLKVLPFHGQLSEEMQENVFKVEKGVRRCIVSTNIAETSLTIPNIGYVVDTGLQKMSIYNYGSGESLVTVPVSQAGADQRAGRAGRTMAGVCYRMYTLSTYRNDLLRSSVPEIQRTNIYDVVLLLLRHGVKDVFGFDFVDSPSHELIQEALFLLHRLGAVCSTGLLTETGERMAELRMEPSLAKMVVSSVSYGAVDEVTTIASMLSAGEVFYKGFDKLSSLCDQKCDFLTLLSIFNAFASQKNKAAWCNQMNLNEGVLRKAMETKKATLAVLKERGISISSTKSSDVVRRCIVSSLHYNIARRTNMEYVWLSNFRVCTIHPSSVIKDDCSEYVLFYKHLSTKTEYIYCCSSITPEMILEEAIGRYRDRDALLGKRPTISAPKAQEKRDASFEQGTFALNGPLMKALLEDEGGLSETLYDRFEKWDDLNENEDDAVELPRKARKSRI